MGRFTDVVYRSINNYEGVDRGVICFFTSVRSAEFLSLKSERMVERPKRIRVRVNRTETDDAGMRPP